MRQGRSGKQNERPCLTYVARSFQLVGHLLQLSRELAVFCEVDTVFAVLQSGFDEHLCGSHLSWSRVETRHRRVRAPGLKRHPEIGDLYVQQRFPKVAPLNQMH